MKNYSSTQAGILIAVAGSLLIYFGFSESCSQEIISLSNAWIVPLVSGGAFAWIGRLKKGDITPLGFRKDLG